MTIKTLAIIGCGKLSSIIIDALLKGYLPDYQLIAIHSRSIDKAITLAHKAQASGHPCQICSTLEQLIETHPQYIVEAASPAALKSFALSALKNGCNIITLSIGALADELFYAEVMNTAQQYSTHLYVVSGATGGFDVLQTVTLMGDAEANFFNEKGPNALRGTSVYKESMQKEQQIVFQGTATEAISLFPTKVNVTVAASRASVGPKNMKVTMQSTPGFIGDTQRVEIRNPQVHAVIDVYSATAEIAAWSVVNTLRNMSAPIVFC